MSSQALLLVCCSTFPVEATFSIVAFFAILKRVPGNLFYQIARSDSSSNEGDHAHERKTFKARHSE